MVYDFYYDVEQIAYKSHKEFRTNLNGFRVSLETGFRLISFIYTN